MTPADLAMRAALGDANIIAWYDARFPWTITLDTGVSGWADSRPASPGPALVQATGSAQPTYDATARTITFDGTADFLRAATGLDSITAACAIVFVGTLPATAGSAVTIMDVGTSAAAQIIGLRRNVSNGNAFVSIGVTAAVVSAAGSRVLHGRKTAESGGNITGGARLGGGAEATNAGALSDQTWSTLTLSTDRAASPSNFSASVFQAALVIKGTYTAAMQNAVNEWARSTHGATI